MKTNQEILDEFGGIIINDIYDDSIKYFNQLIENKTKWERPNPMKGNSALLVSNPMCIIGLLQAGS